MLRGPAPPVSLPGRAFMERARVLWEELGLPPLRPEPPWHGYALGDWSEKWEDDARAAAAGRYRETARRAAGRRRSDVLPNQPVREAESGPG